MVIITDDDLRWYKDQLWGDGVSISPQELFDRLSGGEMSRCKIIIDAIQTDPKTTTRYYDILNDRLLDYNKGGN